MIVNSMEKACEQIIRDMTKHMDGVCTCDVCFENMMCIALNKLPPKYVSSQKGEIFTKIDQQMIAQNKMDIEVAVITAIDFVKEHLRH
jgi:competence protein ComFB